MTANAKANWTRRAGLSLGLGLAALAGSGWVTPPGDRPAGLDATISVLPTGELGFEPSGRIGAVRDLRPGQGLSATTLVTNQTSRPLAVWARTTNPTHDVDARLRVRTSVGRATVVDAALANARAWNGGIRIPSGARRRVRVDVSIPAGERGTEYRAADLKLELRGEPVR